MNKNLYLKHLVNSKLNKIKLGNFIFIIGCGHSGTSILNKILSNHKDIHGILKETNMLINLDDDISRILQNYNSEKLKLNKKYICEKTPKHVYHIDKMYKFINKPKIIIITRDGRDVISSIKKRFGDIETGLNRWINDNNQWLNNSNINDFHILKYEDFVSNKIDIIKKICNYLDIIYYDEIFNYSKDEIELPEDFFVSNDLINHKKHELLRKYQINQDIYDGSKRWVNDLSPDELKIIYANNDFMKMMQKLNYSI
jgi:hypothetical protein